MQIGNLPQLTFADANIDEMLENAKTIAEKILGREVRRADPLMLFLKSMIAVIAQYNLLLDELAKMNLLAYSKGKALEHLGALVGVERLAATKATCSCKVCLSDIISHAVTIQKGTRVHSGDDIYFSLDEDLIFLSGETELEGKFSCSIEGEVGNGYKVGELNKIVDPQAFLLSIENITISDGGSDIESDDNLRERIRIAPESFSTAGPSGAYEFFVKKASDLITDVEIVSEKPGEVDIYFLQSNSDLPTQEVIDKVYETLSDRTVRPLTDKVIIKNPVQVDYEIDLRYFISRSDAANQLSIQKKVEAAIEEFILWQRSELGRDLNDSRLIEMIRQAGAKRVEIISPAFQIISENSVAICTNKNILFAGLEEN